jgi:3-dehydroquinate synthase
MGMDKKVRDDRIRLVLLKPLGAAVLAGDYPADVLRSVVSDHFGDA